MPLSPAEHIYRWRGLPLLVGVVCLLFGAWAMAWPTLRPTADLTQSRLDTALPAPQAGQWIEQPFTPRRAGLSEVELLMVNYEGQPQAGALTLELREAETGLLIASEQWHGRQISHNQPLTLRFAPQPASANRRYVLRLVGTAENPLAVWGYRLATSPATQLTLQGGLTSPAQQLRFTTRYQWPWSAALRWLGPEMVRQLPALLLTLLFITLPGAVWLAYTTAAPTDLITRWGIAVALGISCWSLLWLWLTTLGGWVAGWFLWLVLAGLAAVWLRRQWRLGWPRRPTADWAHTAAFALFLCATWGVRLLAVRDLTFLPWVDASRHGLITAVMASNGRFLTQYQPYLPVDDSFYHAGFHTLPASLQLLTGGAWPLATQLLWLMQWLSALLPLTLYAGTWWLTQRRTAAWLAAFLAAVPFLFPAYYTTWGRLTQLTGVLLLPLLVAATWHILHHTPPRPWGMAAVVGGLAAGLFLIHMRVFVIYLPLAAVLLIGRWAMPHAQRGTAALLGAGAGAAVLIAPRALYLARLSTQFRGAGGGEGGGGDYNVFPTGYITTGWERYYWLAAAVLLFWLLGAWYRRQPGTAVPLALAAWVAALGVGTAGNHLGLPILLPTLNLNSMYIALFVPLAMFGGSAAVALGHQWRQRHWLVQLLGYVLAGAVLAAMGVHGLYQQATVLNATTILAQPADAAGIQWLADHTPPTARIGHSSWLWLGGTWAGSDGGAWLTPLTGRPSTTPPIDYIYDAALFTAVDDFNVWAQAVDNWAEAAVAAELRQRGVDYLFVGQRGGYLDPAELSQNPALALRFAAEGVYVFEVRQEGVGD